MASYRAWSTMDVSRTRRKMSTSRTVSPRMTSPTEAVDRAGPTNTRKRRHGRTVSSGKASSSPRTSACAWGGITRQASVATSAAAVTGSATDGSGTDTETSPADAGRRPDTGVADGRSTTELPAAIVFPCGRHRVFLGRHRLLKQFFGIFMASKREFRFRPYFEHFHIFGKTLCTEKCLLIPKLP